MTEIAKLADIPQEGGLRVEVNDHEIALFRVGDEVYAIDPVCPHAGGPLDQGDVDEGIVTCPWHAWEFDLCKGECVNTGEEITQYDVEIRDGKVFLV